MRREVLLVDDSDGDVRLSRQALRESTLDVNLSVATDGVEDLAYPKREGVQAKSPWPAPARLDFDMPGTDGRELVPGIKSDSSLRKRPAVILTTSDAEADIEVSYELQASCYLRKPGEWAGFTERISSPLDFWLSRVKRPQLEQRDDRSETEG